MTFSSAKRWVVDHSNVIFFIGGFLFDTVTLARIDSVLDLSIQGVYMIGITILILLQAKEELGLWHPGPKLAKLWHHNVEALHFAYGALLSSYVIFYFRSTTFSHSAIFWLLVVGLMFANEMPQVKKAGAYLRLGLHAFCIGSYLNYLLPVLIGRMNAWIFFLSLFLAGCLMALLVRVLARDYVKAGWALRPALLRLGWPPALILSILAVFYVLKWIPPVPLSLQYSGIFHDVRWENSEYALTYQRPPWYLSWRTDSRPFHAAPGDVMHCFARVFAPTRFTHRIYMNWERKTPAGYQSTDRIAMSILGGRNNGFRGSTEKSLFEPGSWRVNIETEDGRTIGTIDFRVIPEPADTERQWLIKSM